MGEACNNEKPQTYKDWRRLWHNLARDLGHAVAWNLQHGKPATTRETWSLANQMYRVHLQMEAEAEACTSGWCEALLQLIFD